MHKPPVSPPGTITLECIGCRDDACAKGGCRRALAFLDAISLRRLVNVLTDLRAERLFRENA